MTTPNLRALSALALAVGLTAGACGDGPASTEGGPLDTATTTIDMSATTMDMSDGDVSHHDDMAHTDDGHAHQHEAQVWDGATSPAVSLLVAEDPRSGWNVFADVTGYRFAPEHASTDHVPGEGHAHIYVDGQRLARVYGGDFHIAHLDPGAHQVTFALSANTHDEYMLDGVPLAASATVVAPESDGAGHHHGEPRAWDGSGTPTVEVAVVKDPKSGWNMMASVTGFTITPRAASTAHVPGEGHMHLYVNGDRLARIYTTAFHIPELAAGTNLVEVRLSGNDHRDYAIDGELVAGSAAFEVAEADGAPPEGAHADDMHALGDPDQTIELEMSGGSVAGGVDRIAVELGSVVMVSVIADIADAVHVHGYDLFADVGPDRRGMIHFVADIPGVFEVEVEGAGVLLAELEVS